MSEDDRSGHSRLTPSEEERISLIRSGGLSLDGPPPQSLGFGGLAPSSHSVGLGGLQLSRTDFSDYRKHGPRMRIEDLNAPDGEFVARAPTSVFPRRVNRTRTPGIHAISDFADPALAATAVPPTAPAGVSQNIIPPARAQPRAPNFSTEALDINYSAPAPHRR